jgi:hypothetical protein
MKTQNAFWTTILLLTALGIGACTPELAQVEGPAAEQSSQEPQEQESGA